MKVLVAASGGEGHLGPLLPFVGAARRAGDEVMIVVPPAQRQTAEASGAHYRVTESPPADEVAEVRRALASSDRGVRTHAAEVELFGRINTAAALEITQRTAREFRPDLMLREPCDYASAVVATRLGIPVATVGISPGRADISGLMMASTVVEPLAPGVRARIEASPYLTRFPEDGSTGYADTRRYGFPSTSGPRTVSNPSVSNPPLVWLTMGTVNTDLDQADGTWDAAVAALAELDVDVLASVGRGGRTVAPTARMDVVEWVDLPDILDRASAVVCHGGSGTTLAALAAGVPVVVVPMIADQPTNAAMVESLGAGITIAPSPGAGLTPSDVPRLRRAIVEVLNNPGYRRAATQAATLFSSAPSVDTRMDQLRVGL